MGMGPEVIIVPVVFAIPAAVIIARSWFKHQERMATFAQPAAPTPAIDARLERVEQAIEAIAVEMERVGEGQRFLTKILADRPQALPEGAPQSRGRVIMPH